MGELPWVRHATHLGHELSELCNMELDSRIKSARFIENSTAIQEQFSFAHPQQILQATHIYASLLFGSKLWALSGNRAGMAWRCWDQAVKRAWRVPLSTHRYTVANLLSAQCMSLRQKILPQYSGFFHSLLSSARTEVQLVANIVGINVGTNTGSNMKLMAEEFSVSPWVATASLIREKYPVCEVPPDQEWVLPELATALDERLEREGEGEEGEEMEFLTFVIDSYSTIQLVFFIYLNLLTIRNDML